jgi:hypothetical protein
VRRYNTAEGVIVAVGGMTGGYAIYIKVGRCVLTVSKPGAYTRPLLSSTLSRFVLETTQASQRDPQTLLVMSKNVSP